MECRYISGCIRDLETTRGVPDVCVSNGQTIVRSDATGCYRLDLSPTDHRFVFVSTPDGYESVDAFYRSTAGWESSREDVDFQLRSAPVRNQQPFRFVHLTDIHLMLGENEPTFGDFVAAELARVVSIAEPAFLTVGGDLTNSGEIGQLRRYREAVNSLCTPVFSMFGGHDGAEECFTSWPYGDISKTGHYEQIMGPAWYSFDWGGWHFVMYPNQEECFSSTDRRHLRQWLEQDLSQQASDRPIIMTTHSDEIATVGDLVSRYNVVLILFGHWHSSKVIRRDGRIEACTPPPTWGGTDASPRGFRVVEVDRDTVRLELKVLSPAQSQKPRTNFGPFRVEWQQNLPTPGPRCGPVSAGNNLLMAVGDEDLKERQGLYCFDAQTGEERWRVATDTSVKNQPVVAGDLCVAVSVAGQIHAADLATGSMRWQVTMPGYPDRWNYASPVADDRNVYVGTQQGLLSYRLEDGHCEWQTPLAYDVFTWRCAAGPVLHGELVLFFQARRGIVAVSRETGELRWSRPVAEHGAFADKYPSPVVVDGLLVSGGDSGHLIVLDAATGDIVWHKDVLEADYATTLAVHDRQIIAVTVDGLVQCFNLHTGRRQWQYGLGQDLLDMIPRRRGLRTALAQPVFMGKAIIVSGIDGCLHVLDPGGECLGRAEFGSPISATPHVAGEHLYAAIFDGRLFKLAFEGNQL